MFSQLLVSRQDCVAAHPCLLHYSVRITKWWSFQGSEGGVKTTKHFLLSSVAGALLRWWRNPVFLLACSLGEGSCFGGLLSRQHKEPHPWWQEHPLLLLWVRCLLGWPIPSWVSLLGEPLVRLSKLQVKSSPSPTVTWELLASLSHSGIGTPVVILPRNIK